VSLLAFIPSPSHSSIHLGLTIHMYGLTLLLAIAACMALTGIRYVRRGGNWDLIFQAGVWGVVAGIVGARLYHDVTSWDQVQAIHAWWAPFAVWKGGLGIYGGLLFGVGVGALIVRRAGESIPKMMDLVAPGLLLAQAIGRWGNWWNQELFGKPTKLPWGLEIAAGNRPAGYGDYATFHPTFLYESLYALVGVVLLLWLERRFRFRSPALFALYVAYYALGRFFEELIRIDPAHMVAGLRLNAWISIFIFALAWGFFVWWQFLRERGELAFAGGGPPPPAPRPKPKRRRKEPSVEVKGPKMTVPKSRSR
jgi:prolipoprotein diacylglyceryl transferase